MAGKCDDTLDESTKKWSVLKCYLLRTPSLHSAQKEKLLIHTISQIHSLYIAKVQMMISQILFSN